MDIWFLKPIPSWDGYFATDTGLIISSKSGEHKEMKQVLKNDYLKVSLTRQNSETGKSITKQSSVHRLVCLAWLPNPNDFPVVNHKDGNKKNNNLNNLEWATYSRNRIHSRDELGNKNYSRNVIQTDLNGKFISEFLSMADAQKITGVSYKSISKVCNGTLRQTGGFLWFYKENYIEGQSKMRKETKKNVVIDINIKDWVVLDLYPGYKISSDGCVYSLGLKRLLKSYEESSGYKTIKVVDSKGKRGEIRVHRLVAMAYIPNPGNLKIVNHIDGNPSNNHYKNLEWCTQKQNVKHAIDTDLKFTRKVVQMKDGVIGSIFKNARTASEKTGVHLEAIRSNLCGKTKSSGGYVWKYLTD